MEANICLVVLESARKLGDSIYKLIVNEKKKSISIIYPETVRFNNGEGKVIIKNNVRNQKVFIISDVGNHSCTYNLYGHTNVKSPDDHYIDIKRTISAMKGQAESISVIMPILYASRQHKRKLNESLDCAMALQDLMNLGVDRIITIDAHDPGVQNAIPCSSFENYYPTKYILNELLERESCNLEEMLVISPDMGAMERARYYADLLKSDLGVFYKRRDLSKVIDGKNPILAHEYMGCDISGKITLVVDDMIASGDSMLEVSREIKKKHGKKNYLISTFAFFTEGIEKFDKAYAEGVFEKLYVTNATYFDTEYLKREWLVVVDCSLLLAEVIFNTIKDIDGR